MSYGSGSVLATFLQSIRDFEGSIPVVVVDNKPDGENVRLLAEQFDAYYVALPDNPGYGAGMNAGVAALRKACPQWSFDAFFFCNPDVKFLGPVVNKLAHVLDEDPALGSIGPRLLNEDGSTYPSARNIPSIGTGTGHALFSGIWPRNPWSRAYQNADNYETRRASGSLSGAAVMLKSSVFDIIGGWDEAYFMHFEDIDLGWRIGRAGYSNIYEPSVAVEHLGAHSTKKHAVVVEQAMTKSAVRFMSQRYSGWWNAPLRWAIISGIKFRGALRVRSIRRAEGS